MDDFVIGIIIGVLVIIIIIIIVIIIVFKRKKKNIEISDKEAPILEQEERSDFNINNKIKENKEKKDDVIIKVEENINNEQIKDIDDNNFNDGLIKDENKENKDNKDSKLLMRKKEKKRRKKKKKISVKY